MNKTKLDFDSILTYRKAQGENQSRTPAQLLAAMNTLKRGKAKGASVWVGPSRSTR